MTDAALTRRPRRRLEHLDGLRALAALAVLVHHAWAMIFPPQAGVFPTGALALTFPAKFGPYGVTVFIILAGYSLTLAVSRRAGHLPNGAWTFIKRRAKRILPPYYAAIVLTLILSVLWLNHKTGTHWDLSVPLDWKGVVTNLLLVQDLVPFEATNVAYTFWSIAVEWHIYFTFPLLLIVWRRYGYLAATTAGAALGVAGGYAALMFPQLETLHADYYALFAIGMGACAIASLSPAWAARVPWFWLSGAGVIGWAGLVAVDVPQALKPLLDPDLALGVAVAAMLIGVSQGTGWVYRGLSWKPLARLGVFSYSLYLVHAPLLQVIWLLLVEPFNLSQGAALAVMWLVAAPLIIAAAYGFHVVAERPFMTPSREQRPVIPAARHVRQG
jgi:peptidoglycan/LPS O-acetylase OafA/YrhL